MRILIPALQVGPGQTGVGTYTLEMVRAMSRLAPEDEFVIAAPHPGSFDFLDGIEGFSVVPIQLLRENSWGRMLCLHSTVPRLAKRLGADLVWAPSFIVPLWGPFSTTVLVHDFTFVRFPETMPRLKRWYYRMMVGHSMRRAELVFVVSKTMAREAVSYEPSALRKLRIAPGGVSSAYLDNGDEEREGAADLPGEGRRDFLFVGTLEPRKNLERLLAAHANQCRFDPEFPALKIVGGRGWEDEGIRRALAAHSDPKRLRLLGYLDEEGLRREYDASLALLFPSVYEGFGLPAVEAMTRGCPVLASRGTATAEVAAGAALLVDPLDTGELERAMRRLATDSALRGRLRASGRARARFFSWERSARITLEAIRSWKGSRLEKTR